MEVKQNVTHPIHGKGIVVNTYRNGKIVDVDYKGVMRTHMASEFGKQNVYKIQKSPEDVVESVLYEIERIKDLYCNGNTPQAEGGRIVLDRLIERIQP